MVKEKYIVEVTRFDGTKFSHLNEHGTMMHQDKDGNDINTLKSERPTNISKPHLFDNPINANIAVIKFLKANKETHYAEIKGVLVYVE